MLLFCIVQLHSTKQHWLIVGLFAAVALLVYGSSLSNDFVNYDDTRLILENELIRNMDPISWWQIFTSYEEVLYAPLLFISYQIDYAFAELNPWMYHAHSLLLHTLTAWLVSVLMTLLTKKKWLSVMIGLLFLVQPLNTELITWASLRKDVLAGLFGVCTLLSYVYAQQKNTKKWYWASVGCFALALLSKPSVMTVPLVLPIFDVILGKPWKANLKKYVSYGVLAVAILAINLMNANQVMHNIQHPLTENLLLSFKSSAMLLLWFVVPLKHAVIHPFTEEISLFNWQILLPMLVVISVFVAAWRWRKTQPVYLQGLLIFLILLLPSFRSFRFGENFGDVYFTGERYAYLPMLGLLWIVLHLLAQVQTRYGKKLTLGGMAVVLCIYASVSHAQADMWRDTKTLFKNVVREYPNAQMAHNNLGTIYAAEGLHDLAIRSYQRALDVRPTGQVYANVGKAYANAGQLENALEAYNASLQFNPINAPVLLNIGVAHFKLGNTEDAITAFTQLARLDPTSPIPWVNIGVAREMEGNIPEAIRAYEKVIELAPEQVQIQQKLEILKTNL